LYPIIISAPLSELKKAHPHRLHLLIDRVAKVLTGATLPHRKENISIAMGPSFVPLNEVTRKVIGVAESNQLNMLRFTCYSTPSQRHPDVPGLPDVDNVYDFLQTIGVPRRVDFNPKSWTTPEFEEDDPKYDI